MKKTKTGEMTRRVTLQSPETVSDGRGGFNVTWTTALTAWGRVRRLYGYEAAFAGALAGRQTVEVHIRASDAARAVTTSWRLVETHSGRVFNVRDVNESDDRSMIVILAESGVPS